ncbi:MAG: ribose-phosphate pyrophosphokinase [Zetaproteobacteria bacterium]|nr:MAG: ribose-phosphate pyrophosphokinase [Zetaproteobacteria bacterium]
MIHRKLRLFSGTSNPPLAQAISEAIGTPLGDISIRRFSDGEIYLQYGETIRGKDVFFIQPTSALANTNLMELLIAIDAAKRASARQICAVTPYFGYARQDRKSSGRTPITAKLVADMIEVAGATRVLTMDLHAGQIQGFFNIPVDNIYAAPLFARDIQEHNALDRVTIVSPDVGGVVRARALAKRLHVDMAIVDKRRPAPNEAEVMNIIGDVDGKHCILVDDMVDTAGTLCNAAQALVERGASKVTAYATHGVLSGPAADRLETTDALHELVITDTILQPERILQLGKVRVLSAAPLLAETISRIYDARSISSLYN